MNYKKIKDYVMMENDGNIAIALNEKEVNLDIYFVNVTLEGHKILIDSNNYESNTGMMLPGLSKQWQEKLKDRSKIMLAEVKGNGEFGYIVEADLEVV